MKGIVLFSLALLAAPIFAGTQKTICGVTDDRELSTDAKVGRLLDKLDTEYGVCTTTMISETCAISAGHCSSTFQFVEFNTLPSLADGTMQRSSQEDIYKIDQDTIVTEYSRAEDWAVFKVLPNEITGKTAGGAQGYYPVNLDNEPQKGDTVRITGYGLDNKGNERHLAQKTHTGEITSVDSTRFRYDADTTGGNSGSAVVNENTGEIVGIHTNGGCSRFGGSNMGTRITGNPALVAAIRSCLASE